VFGVLAKLSQQEGWDKAELGRKLVIGSVQAGRWLAMEREDSDSALGALCKALQKYIEADPANAAKWLKLVAARDFADGLQPFKNLLFFDENFPYPEGPQWVVASEPREFKDAKVRELVRRRILKKIQKAQSENPGQSTQAKPYLVYWIPRRAEPAMRDHLFRLEKEGFSFDGQPASNDAPDAKEILNEVKVIIGPDHMAMLSLGIINPEDDDRIAFVSTALGADLPLRIQVLPSASAMRIYESLEPIWLRLVAANEGKTEHSGATWTLMEPQQKSIRKEATS
jgi:hypothetical protein